MSEFDPDKDAVNKAKHGISLAEWNRFDPVVTYQDDRFDYGEVRHRAYGYIDGRPYCFVFTIRNGIVRPISLRRARAKEMKRYAPPR